MNREIMIKEIARKEQIPKPKPVVVNEKAYHAIVNSLGFIPENLVKSNIIADNSAVVILDSEYKYTPYNYKLGGNLQ